MSNLLVNLRPDIAKQFDHDRNLDIDLSRLTIGSGKKIWWKCECGEKWSTTVCSRRRTKAPAKCNKCSRKGMNSVPTLGVNDMWTTNSQLASLLLNKEDGYKYMQDSGLKLDWKCPECKTIIKDKTPNIVKKYGLSCPDCSDGKSYPEKFIYYLLKELKIEFKMEHCFDWGEGKRYDFYIPSMSIIIEVHGIQHYEDRVNRSTKTEQEINDKLKKDNCLRNNLRYIEVDARYSTLSHLEQSIKNSELSEHFDTNNVDYSIINKRALNSLTVIISELWNEGKTKSEIIETTGFCSNTITSYLKKQAKQNSVATARVNHTLEPRAKQYINLI